MFKNIISVFSSKWQCLYICTSEWQCLHSKQQVSISGVTPSPPPSPLSGSYNDQNSGGGGVMRGAV